MSGKSFRILIAISGIVGTLALMAYFTAPFTFMPMPPPNTGIEELKIFGIKYHDTILFDAWLQQAGSFLSVLFTLGLVHMAGKSQTFAGRITWLVSAVILGLSLAEGTFELSAVFSGDNGHLQSSLAAFDLTNVFIHVFLITPSLFLVQGIALWNTRILPHILILLSIILGAVFQVMGTLGLFYPFAVLIVIFILMAQNIWTLVASGALIFWRAPAYRD